MSWFQKFLGLGKKEDTGLTLKLRLNRLRHLLRAEWACDRLLSDLKEKNQGEYIFDRQYVFSTVGQVFQKAYQMVYDGLILGENREMDLYLRLDRMRDEAQTFLNSFNRSMKNTEVPPPREKIQKGIGEGNKEVFEEKEDLDQEPEFQMLAGIIKLLDPSDPISQNQWPETIEKVQNLRMALRWTHEQVLKLFVNPEALQYWITAGLAFPFLNPEELPLYGVDLGEGMILNKNKARKPDQLEKDLASYKPWSLFHNGLSNPLISGLQKQRKKDPPLFMVVSENSIFLSGNSQEGQFVLDMVLTSVRELNHFFFRWQAGSGDSLFIRNLSSIWEWTDRQEKKVYELTVFQKPPKEIERYGSQIGQAIALW